MDSGSAAAFFWAEIFLIEILTEWNSPPLTITLMRKRVDDDEGMLQMNENMFWFFATIDLIKAAAPENLVWNRSTRLSIGKTGLQNLLLISLTKKSLFLYFGSVLK